MSTKDITDLQVCLAVKAFHERDLDLPWPYEALAGETGQAEKVCFHAMRRADRRGYLDYGVSLRTAWLTEKGEQLVAQGVEPLAAPKEGSPHA